MISKRIDSHSIDDLQISQDGKRLFFLRQSLTTPSEIYSSRSDGSQLTALTRLNQALLGELDLLEPQSIWFEGAGGTRIQAWMMTPPGFDPKKNCLLLLLVHGGPQQAMERLVSLSMEREYLCFPGIYRAHA